MRATGTASSELLQQRGAPQPPPGAVNRKVAELGAGRGLALFSQTLLVTVPFQRGAASPQTAVSGEAQRTGFGPVEAEHPQSSNSAGWHT